MTEPEQVLVNVADLRTLAAFLSSPSWAIWVEADEAFGRLTSAAPPDPKWEPIADVDPLARFLLEHDHCGDDDWATAPERRRDFYRVLATSILSELHREGQL